MLIILTKSFKLNILYFEGFKEFKAIAVIGNMFSICSQKWTLISHVRTVTSERQNCQPQLCRELTVHLSAVLPLTAGKFWNLKFRGFKDDFTFYFLIG